MSAQKIRILVVEDEESLRGLYVQLLEGEGYEVDHSSDGEDAYLKMMEQTYDLILLDIMLPKKDGLHVLSDYIKHQTKSKKKTPIVLLTNLAENETIAKALKSGVSGYMIKSRYSPDEFLAEIQKYL